ncbi:MAG: DUF1801 domain-containing protein [Polyangiales bacterium]
MATKKSATKKSATKAAPSEELDWRAETLDRVRAILKEADPEAIEERKWRNVPTFSHDGILFTGETYKGYVKLTFAKGASLADPAKLFNASLEGNMRRAIDIREQDKLNEKALKTLIRAAVALNQAKAKR